MELIGVPLNPIYVAGALAAVATCLACCVLRRRQNRLQGTSSRSTWSVKSLMTKDEARAILPRLMAAAEGMYVFPRLAAPAVLQPPRRLAAAYESGDLDVHDLIFDYAVYTSECELVCVVLVDHGKKATPADELRDELLRSAELPVIKLRPGQMPEPAVLRGHLQLALDQRRGVTKNLNAAKAPSKRLVAA